MWLPAGRDLVDGGLRTTWPGRARSAAIEGLAKRELENALNRLDAQRQRDPAMGDRVLAQNGGSSEENGRSHRVGVHKADRLLSRQRGVEHAWDNAICHLERRVSPAEARHLDTQSLIDTINATAERLPDKAIFDALSYLLNARE